MQIENGKVVSFHYTLRGEDGLEIEKSTEGQAMLYLHGHGGLLPALQEELAGRVAGDNLSVTVPPERAYGMRRENAQHRIPLKHVIGYKAGSRGSRLTPGAAIRVNTPQGERDATVVKAGKFNVDVDTNHPLAGKQLTFDLWVESVREATEDELAHGHAHGVGGHQH